MGYFLPFSQKGASGLVSGLTAVFWRRCGGEGAQHSIGRAFRIFVYYPIGVIDENTRKSWVSHPRLINGGGLRAQLTHPSLINFYFQNGYRWPVSYSTGNCSENENVGRVFTLPVFPGRPCRFYCGGAGFTPGHVELVANEPRFPVAPHFFIFYFFDSDQWAEAEAQQHQWR